MNAYLSDVNLSKETLMKTLKNYIYPSTLIGEELCMSYVITKFERDRVTLSIQHSVVITEKNIFLYGENEKLTVELKKYRPYVKVKGYETCIGLSPQFFPSNSM